jgi:hypothetical protein
LAGLLGFLAADGPVQLLEEHNAFFPHGLFIISLLTLYSSGRLRQRFSNLSIFVISS